ncbi:MAG: MBL fold metallo-hydrolase, partial [Oscillospiraceae bacterium]|nr:MBL fold metallo-hydrolase [Oscillospiraceae bacterium]
MKIVKRLVSCFLLISVLLSMIPLIFASRKIDLQENTQTFRTAVGSFTEQELKQGTWNLDGAYRQLRPALTKSGYWNATKADSYNKLITGDSISTQFFATPRFCREDIPVGSVIVVEQGWQYRPEGWVTDSRQTLREENVTEKFIQVTEQWWSNYTLRGFNISKVDGSVLTDLYSSDIHEAFRIYVPDEYVALGYERYYPKLEHCAYWNCVDNRIYTRNSASDADKYFTTAKLTKEQLPVGSVMVLEEGWEYRPEAWITNAKQTARQDVERDSILNITEEWWGKYSLRVFNLHHLSDESLGNYTTEDIHCILRFYVPKKTTHIPGLPDEQTNAETTLHQIPSQTPGTDGEFEKTMSYILRSREGKIVVIDGGYEKTNNDGKMLFAYLQRITGKAKPHVDAWIMTHGHPDHFAAFLSVAKLYRNQITVDGVYHHFINKDQANKYCNETTAADMIKYYDKLVSHTAMLKNAKGQTTPLIEVNSAHSGKCNSTLDFDEIHIDILLTCEDVYSAADSETVKLSGTLEENGNTFTNRTLRQVTGVNDTSVVFRVTVHGKTVLFLGDSSIASEYVLTKYHNENAKDGTKYYSLKSDIVQVSHHGVQAMGKAIYHLINPDVALWCTPYHTYASRPGDYHTTYYIRQWFRTALATTNYVSFDGVDVLRFPVIRSAGAVSIPAELKPYVFSATYYADRYSDLKEAYGTDEGKLYEHFIKYGIEEGRCASPFFDVRFYINNNTRSFRETMKGNYEKAFKHFLSNYKSTDLMKLSLTFDPMVYQDFHKELSTQFDLLKHYAEHGYPAGVVATSICLTATGHSYHTGYATTAYVAPTCTTEGATASAMCNSCSEVFASREILDPLGHSYEAVDTVLSCEEGSNTPESGFFANFTGDSDRYLRSSVYGGVDYDRVDHWSYLDTRYRQPVVDTEAGTMQIGFQAEGYSHLWIQTGESYNDGFNLKYQPKSDHMIKLRLRFEGLQVLQGKSNSYLRLYYFVGPDRFEGKVDKVERLYSLDTVNLTPKDLSCGEFVTVCVPLKGLDSTEHSTLTALRFQFGDLQSIDSTKPGSIVMDYIYVGPDTAQMVSYLCRTCGHTYTEDHAEPLGHIEVVHGGVAPTCTAGGLSSWTDCDRCGEILVPQQNLSPTGHRYVEETVLPTCLNTGKITKICTLCGDSPVIKLLPATGHSYMEAVTAPTCTEEGYTTYCCKNCEDSYVAKYVAPLGHLVKTVVGTAPTCTSGGMTQGSYCDRCGETLIRQETLPPLGHSYEVLGQKPHCTEGVSIPESAFFTNFTDNSDRYMNNPLYGGVDYDKASNWSYLDARYQGPVVDTDSGTMKIGFKTLGYHHLWVQTGESYNEGFCLKYQPKNDHMIRIRLRFEGLRVLQGKSNAYLRLYYFVGPDRFEGKGDKVERLYSLDAIPLTSEQINSGEFVILSAPLGGLDSAEHTTLTALRLQFGDIESENSAVPGTITMDYIYLGPEKGSPVTYKCSNCGDHYTVDSLAASDHSYTTKVTAPTCTVQGYTTYTCSHCSYSYKDNYINAKGHTEVIDKAVPATCTASGKTEGKHCSVCNIVLIKQETVAALGHSYTTNVTAPACTAQGYTTYTCSRCSHSYKDNYINAKGHTEVIDKEIPATCTEDGQTEGKH